MVFDYGSLIRLGSAFLFCVVGLFLVVRKPRSKPMMVWGAFYIVVGASNSYQNLRALLGAVFIGEADLVVLTLVALASSALLVWLHRWVFALLQPAQKAVAKRLAAAGLAFGLAYLIILVYAEWTFPGAPLPRDWLVMVFSNADWLTAMLVTGLWIVLLEALRTGRAPHARSWLLATFPFLGSILGRPLNNLSNALFLVREGLPAASSWALAIVTLAAFSTIAWCFRLMPGPHARFARNLQLGLLGWLLALTLFYAAFLGPVESIADVRAQAALLGVVRTLALGTVVHAILREDFLPTPMKLPAIRRAHVAAAGLGALFIVAQVLQSFLSDLVSLKWAGVVAGFVVVVAFPVQRRLERISHGGKDAERTFRDAARLAVRDRRLTRKEELSLLDLAHRLGLPPGRATAIVSEEQAQRRQAKS